MPIRKTPAHGLSPLEFAASAFLALIYVAKRRKRGETRDCLGFQQALSCN